MALGVWLSSAVWESALERTARRRVLVVGSSAVTDIIAAARRGHRVPFEVFGTLTAAPEGVIAQPGAAVLGDLAAVVEAQQPDYIVLTDPESSADAVDRLLDMTDRRFRVASLTSFYEHVFGCVPSPYMTPIWFLSLLHVRQRMYRRPAKRLFDVFAASVGLVLAAPVIALLALLIKRTPGPVIYRQTRVGEAGRRFTIYKLRSMGVTAERPGEPVFAQPNDPRVTGVGRFMRRTHLDELPQLWNILRGDMSMVGPRPERPEFVAMLEDEVPYWSRRLLMKPGVTGWAQVRCGYATDCVSSAEKLSYDFWYMRHNSLAVDFAVCARTLLLALEVLTRATCASAAAARRAGTRRREDRAARARGALRAPARGLRRRRLRRSAEQALGARRRPAVRPAAPARYRVPSGALRVSSAGELRDALAARRRRAIVLAPGDLRRRAAVRQPARPPALRGATRALGAERRAEPGREPGPRRRTGARARVRRPRPAADGRRAPRSWCGGPGAARASWTRRSAAIASSAPASRPAGPRAWSCGASSSAGSGTSACWSTPTSRTARSSESRSRSAISTSRTSPGRHRVRRWGEPRPASGSATPARCGACARARARGRGCGPAPPRARARFEAIDVDRTQDRRLPRALHDRQHVPLAADRPASARRPTAEWADPAWGRRPASVGNVIEDSRFASPLVGVYLDEGTTRTTVRRSSFANQTWAAIGDYRGIGQRDLRQRLRGVAPASGTTISAQPGRDKRWR